MMEHTIVEWIGDECCSVLVHRNGRKEVLDCIGSGRVEGSIEVKKGRGE